MIFQKVLKNKINFTCKNNEAFLEETLLNFFDYVKEPRAARFKIDLDVVTKFSHKIKHVVYRSVKISNSFKDT